MNETYTSSSANHYKFSVNLAGMSSGEQVCLVKRRFRLVSLPVEAWLWLVVAALFTVSAALQVYSIWLRTAQ